MMNWIKFIAAFLLALSLIIIVIVFYNANEPFSDVQQKAKAAAVNSGVLVYVERTEIYNGTVSMVTVFGEDDEGVEKAVFMEVNTGEILDEVAMKDGIGSKAAIETVKAELSVEEILHVALGLEEGHPVWEVAFKGENGKLNYVYVFFKNGEWWKRILNL